MTARVCRSSFSRAKAVDARGKNSVNGGWDADIVERHREFQRTITGQRTTFEERADHLFHEERITLGLIDNEAFEIGDSRAIADRGTVGRSGIIDAFEQRVEHLIGAGDPSGSSLSSV